jgi:peptidoglycan/xylan/chitin deacetylase (PgdA/CDA1 family)
MLTAVMYHYVRDLKISRYPEIKGLDYFKFKEQVSYIKKHYNPVTVKEVIAYYYHQQPLPPKAILLTFDDGYSDHFKYVFPILEKHKIQGCFYPPVSAIKGKRVLLVNKIHYALASEPDPRKIINFIFQELETLRKDHALESNEKYYAQYAISRKYDGAEIGFIKNFLQKGLERELREKLSAKVLSRFANIDEPSLSEELYLNKDQIECMIRNGMHFGMHGDNHDWLGTMSFDEQKQEIDESVKLLAEVNANPTELTICYPYGSYNDDSLTILKQKDCKLGFTIEPTIALRDKHSPLELPRLNTNDLPVDSSAEPNDWFYKVS